MVHSGVYCHDVRCPECGSNWIPKDGTSKGRQSYHAATAAAVLSPMPSTRDLGAADKERALVMYQEGSSLSAIARIFGVSVYVVSQWVKKGCQPPGTDAREGRKAHCRRGGSLAFGDDCF